MIAEKLEAMRFDMPGDNGLMLSGAQAEALIALVRDSEKKLNCPICRRLVARGRIGTMPHTPDCAFAAFAKSLEETP